MSTTATKAEPLPEVIPQPTYVRTELPIGIPLYIIQHESAFDEIEADENCPAVYFVLAAAKCDNGETISTKRVEWEEPRLFRRIARSTVGNGLISVGDSSRLGLSVLKDRAYWSLPLIPQELVSKIDGFFRAVHKKHGSESIVLLTYDPTYADSDKPSDGWGVLVPEQVNSGASCDYKPESVVDEKPTHVDIVGSAHSHPEMSAYASHTDVKDQVDFDGLHITMGWQSSKGGQSEWHIEYQLANERFTFTPKDVFEIAPEADWVDPNNWMDKVTKYVAPPKAVGVGMQTVGRTTGGTTGGSSSPKSSSSPSGIYNSHFRAKHNSARPVGCPDLVKNTVIVQLYKYDDECPICKSELTKHALTNHRCDTCMTYLLQEGEEEKDILEARKKQYANTPYVPGLEHLIGKLPALDVVLWERGKNASNKRGNGTQRKLWEVDRGKGEGGQLGDADRLDSEYITCEMCKEGLVKIGGRTCTQCNFVYDVDYWDERADYPILDEIDLPEGIYSHQVYKSAFEQTGDAQDVDCYDCVLAFTSSCEPFVSWLDQYYNSIDQIPPAPIGICDDFELVDHLRGLYSDEVN